MIKVLLIYKIYEYYYQMVNQYGGGDNRGFFNTRRKTDGFGRGFIGGGSFRVGERGD